MAVPALVPALVAFGDETTRLAGGAGRVWLRLLPRLIALTLLGWAAYHGAVFVGAEVARFSPWLLIPVLSLGVVLRLTTVVVALRSVATELGAPALLERVAPTEVVADDRDRSLSRLLGITLLPFLAVYAAFGYVDSFARDVVLLSTYRFGFSEVLSGLNTLDSPVVGVITIVLVIVLFILRRLLDRWQDRSGRLLPALLAAFVEASGLFVVLLSAFRLVEGASLWLGGRRVAQWWQGAVDWATGWLRFDLPDLVLRAWAFLAETIWPVFWDVFSQPLAWLALAALVFGARVLSLGDLLHAGPPARDGGPSRSQRAREALAQPGGSRRVARTLQETVFGDLDDKYLPAWHALRLVLRAGWAFLGGYVLLFNLVHYAGVGSVDAIKTAIGGRPVGFWINVLPFLDLIPDVLAMSFQLALLGAAFVRILQLRAEPAPGTAPAGVRRRVSRVAEVAVVASLLVGLVAVVALRPDPDAAVHTAAVGERARFTGGQVLVEQVQLGSKVLMLPSKTVETSPLLFVVVRAAAIRPGAEQLLVQPTLVNGARSYPAQGWGSASLGPDPGFSESADFVFEVQPADIDGDLRLEFETQAFLSYYSDVVSVPLGLTPGDAAAAVHQSAAVTSGTDKEAA
ncbi:MAG: hypothetical protein ACOH1Y_00830 [Propionicimonas sp.]